MNDATTWWLLAGALVAAELLTGSFYLLMLALGAATGALCAHLGLGTQLQIVAAAAAGALSTFAWYRYRRARGAESTAIESNRDVNLDIGQTVQVGQWDSLGQTQVSYRGATWHAQFAGPGSPAPGMHRIVALRGNTLELEPC
ncbi:NfeD family protein [Inhella proteolytica]|uniref:NfeD family protein n=1 Tax=Inhella proteolytica TaxID=2795029 RepID=A0A931IZ97_9BURK|nr:NfeD family protein [Inhella proteolytica]MBH9576546.1 NfeD family protein [Inhella proteolytica]